MEDSATLPSLPSHMKAWVYSEYGKSEEVLRMDSHMAMLEMKEDEVLIMVAAGALNPIDYGRITGYFKHDDSPFPITLGFDIVGVVVRVGGKVKKLKVGDEVYGIISHALEHLRKEGSLAEYSVAQETALAHKPPVISRFPILDNFRFNQVK